MRRWARAERDLLCGYCAQRTIRKGDPVCYVKFEKITRELRRCVDCAGPAPPDLPPMMELKTPGDFSMSHIGAQRPKTRGDLKAKAREWTPYAEREPREDG